MLTLHSFWKIPVVVTIFSSRVSWSVWQRGQWLAMGVSSLLSRSVDLLRYLSSFLWICQGILRPPSVPFWFVPQEFHSQAGLASSQWREPFVCIQCNYSFTQGHSLKIHLPTHSGEKTFSCTHCNYSCTRASNLKIHQLAHSGDILCDCTSCNFSFTTTGHLKMHMLIHSGEKPLRCEGCNYSCAQNQNLKMHKLTHSGERPFICTQCNFSCTIAGHLKEHIIRHSGEKLLGVSSVTILAITSVVWSITCFHTIVWNLFACNQCDYPPSPPLLFDSGTPGIFLVLVSKHTRLQVRTAKFVTITDNEFTLLCTKWFLNSLVAKCENHVMQDIGRFAIF